MELYQVEDFVAVVEEHSFTRAADRLFRTQAAVSVAVKKLEEEVGVQLIVRDSHDCAPTEAGEVMLHYARRLIKLRNEMQRAVAEFSTLSAGRVSIAAHESAAQYLLPDPMAEFHRRFPGIKIETRTCSVDEVALLVADRVVDLGFGITQTQVRGLCSEVVHTDPLVLIVAPGHGLTRRSSVRIIDLDNEEFFAHHRRTATADLLEHLFEARGARLHVIAELWNFETIKQFVKASSGVAIIPWSAARHDVAAGTFKVIPVEDLNVARDIEVVYRSKGTLLPAARELLNMLRNWPWHSGDRTDLGVLTPHFKYSSRKATEEKLTD